jgi:UrcA family protein
MTKTFTARFAGVAMLALAAIPLAAAPAVAFAAPSTIQVSDLDLNSAKGVATFQKRAAAVTSDMCKPAAFTGYRVRNDLACRAAVKSEISEKLASAQQAQAVRSEIYAAR